MNFLQTHLWIAIGLLSLISLLIGVFLIEIVYRYPGVMKKKWLSQCLCFLKQEGIKIEYTMEGYLARMRLRPNTHQLSTLIKRLFKTRYLASQKYISFFYAIIPFLTMITSLIVFIHFGFRLQTIWALYFTWILIVISAIDFKIQYIPDRCVFLLLWSGLLLNALHQFSSPILAILGAIIGYISLKIFQKIFYLFRRTEGIGEGDLKLTAALSAWLGIDNLPLLLLIAAIIALIYSLMLIICRKINWKSMIAFGPFLSMSGWLLLVFNSPVRIFSQKVLEYIRW